jgi:hypothetical protein
MLVLEQAETRLLLEVGLLRQSWHQHQSRMLALHNLASSSFRHQDVVARRVVEEAIQRLRSLVAEAVRCIVDVGRMDRLGNAHSPLEKLP